MATPVTLSGGGAAIPDGDSAGVDSDIVSVVLGTVTGNLNVSILGLTHTWVGDLIATLEHVDTGTSQFSFNRVGRTGSGLGDSSNLDGDYSFGNSFSGNLWTTALSLSVGPDEIVPPGDYFASGPDTEYGIDLSGHFNGESAAGTWRLNISDLVGADTGSFTGWELSFETSETAVPEPSSVILVALGIIALAARRGHLRRRRLRPSAPGTD